MPPPDRLGVHEGLSFATFEPTTTPRGTVVVLHGADSCKESHFGFARSCRLRGLAAICFDMRGHGDSPGRLDGRMVDDVASMASLLPSAPLVLRGSSMGGWLALVTGARLDAAAVVAICPASGDGLRRGLDTGRFAFGADREALGRLLATSSATQAARTLGSRLLLLHAAGDESVGVERSRELHAQAPGSRYVETPGGHHRSIQHDGELTAYALRWIDRTLSGPASVQ